MLVELEHFNEGTFELVMSKAKAMIEVRGIFLNSPTFVSLYKPQFFTYLLEILIFKKSSSKENAYTQKFGIQLHTDWKPLWKAIEAIIFSCVKRNLRKTAFFKKLSVCRRLSGRSEKKSCVEKDPHAGADTQARGNENLQSKMVAGRLKMSKMWWEQSCLNKLDF